MNKQPVYYIGWDVGAWNCKERKEGNRKSSYSNRNSQDAIIILNTDCELSGQPWRGNLREVMNRSDDSEMFIEALFELCNVDYDGKSDCYLAIDTPLGYPENFRNLISGSACEADIENEYKCNSYLFRKTEMFLFDRGLRPLSSIMDQIGNQSTKGLHLIHKLNASQVETGVWKHDKLLLLEAYPAANNKSESLTSLQEEILPETDKKSDVFDALSCALTARLYAQDNCSLVHPTGNTPALEGWIWVPKDALHEK